MRRYLLALLAVVGLAAAGCTSAADTASHNLSEAAENFEIQRRVVFINGITGEYILELEGRCSIEDQTTQLEVVCLQGPGELAKHFLGLSDNVTYFVEQIGYADVSTFHYTVRFRPQTIVPNVVVDGSTSDTPSVEVDVDG